jgi:septum site-determining protein MinD
MSMIVSVHSYRGGTGKSNLAANLASSVVQLGKRVAVIDTDIQSPGLHVLFGMDVHTSGLTLNDYLHGRCSIEQAAHDVTATLGLVGAPGGALYVVPSSIKAGEITRVLREGYEVNLLTDGFRTLIKTLQLDYLFIDTHPGLNEETLLSILISDILVLILRPDQQDFQGTAVTVEVARRLKLKRLVLHYSGTSRRGGGSQPTRKAKKRRLGQVSLQSRRHLLQDGNGQVVSRCQPQRVAVVAEMPMRPPGASGDAPFMMSRQAAQLSHKAKRRDGLKPGKPGWGIGFKREQPLLGADHHVASLVPILDAG